ncbi:MAG TPA: phosphoribosylformylglycinamidine synthase subunit PurS [Deltaproteobacteria bacterium]|nr:phosphoribosylformylglycinamidine synthase subunit PurS [Candidatus Binatota bacterium]HIL12742.1 phosphoribosylformylglycinamidine synthase subunit PurS [Deltaproteobacteria bacterium]
MDFVARVYVTPKKAILDPQGKAVASSLQALGYDGVDDVRLGRYIELRLSGVTGNEAAGSRVDEMCRRLLANDVIEDYRFDIEEKLEEQGA